MQVSSHSFSKPSSVPLQQSLKLSDKLRDQTTNFHVSNPHRDFKEFNSSFFEKEDPKFHWIFSQGDDQLSLYQTLNSMNEQIPQKKVPLIEQEENERLPLPIQDDSNHFDHVSDFKRGLQGNQNLSLFRQSKASIDLLATPRTACSIGRLSSVTVDGKIKELRRSVRKINSKSPAEKEILLMEQSKKRLISGGPEGLVQQSVEDVMEAIALADVIEKEKGENVIQYMDDWTRMSLDSQCTLFRANTTERSYARKLSRRKTKYPETQLTENSDPSGKRRRKNEKHSIEIPRTPLSPPIFQSPTAALHSPQPFFIPVSRLPVLSQSASSASNYASVDFSATRAFYGAPHTSRSIVLPPLPLGKCQNAKKSPSTERLLMVKKQREKEDRLNFRRMKEKEEAEQKRIEKFRLQKENKRVQQQNRSITLKWLIAIEASARLWLLGDALKEDRARRQAKRMIAIIKQKKEIERKNRMIKMKAQEMTKAFPVITRALGPFMVRKRILQRNKSIRLICSLLTKVGAQMKFRLRLESFRAKIVSCQNIFREYLICSAARMAAMEEMWHFTEEELLLRVPYTAPASDLYPSYRCGLSPVFASSSFTPSPRPSSLQLSTPSYFPTSPFEKKTEKGKRKKKEKEKREGEEVEEDEDEEEEEESEEEPEKKLSPEEVMVQFLDAVGFDLSTRQFTRRGRSTQRRSSTASIVYNSSSSTNLVPSSSSSSLSSYYPSSSSSSSSSLPPLLLSPKSPTQPLLSPFSPSALFSPSSHFPSRPSVTTPSGSSSQKKRKSRHPFPILVPTMIRRPLLQKAKASIRAEFLNSISNSSSYSSYYYCNSYFSSSESFAETFFLYSKLRPQIRQLVLEGMRQTISAIHPADSN
ncbi:uncharacterized protein MONOS_4810 [Monocercomonoides exilis]|uniref:uncharacterized protein n=1 Tax=Monocercomonoides exilis TaxID=2049356 RepID=UPI00355A15B7|nr:hypothetical protein MONOS_4810 [Monocercomonoides exilis]|eukprot:MONOS_4810.1-p1 / transcript=MONOS_4810.1 / gene=MONOS_4810 / organism=Monocercomonoides_exilis_PA203 / gene_product=unspecified product / transcript_product=unspecified product / location=Mono_scaffold00133:73360-76638(-) / protein_length=870 / sequence_SO=supercontig / SO=protein_coding / is_pseudo=false